MICPFVILIDTAEQHPFSFTGIRSDAAHSHEEYEVNCRSFCLGRHPNSRGDYSIYGHVGRVAVERKSKADAYGKRNGVCAAGKATLPPCVTERLRPLLLPGRTAERCAAYAGACC